MSTNALSDFAPVVIATPTIGDGLVLRWYRSMLAAERATEIVSASRNGIAVHTFTSLSNAPALAELIVTAAQAGALIAQDRDVSDLVTHTRSWSGEVAAAAP